MTLRKSMLKTKNRELATLAIGDFVARETKYCRHAGDITAGSKELSPLVQKGGKFVYDVLIYVGRAFFLGCRNSKAKNKTRALLDMNGGYILHLDGTCEGASPH